ncbi:hypothetical protein HH682_00105 [Rosenbergiella sp. S61]|uniref:Uncharacterized protein n=1 Tax=Rosenbergiella gaditana TaxID=2726987 RepID=A0ABS5STW0_9GAMM|nr:hypothetical protein [Rosenbergiella gaditana]MBT0722868.1 hypothetical protein [Rosenbergiella gaditana]
MNMKVSDVVQLRTRGLSTPQMASLAQISVIVEPLLDNMARLEPQHPLRNQARLVVV